MEVRVGAGVTVSEEGMLVDIFSATVEGETVGLALLKVHAKVVVIKRIRKYGYLIFISPLYCTKYPAGHDHLLSSNAQPEGGRLSITKHNIIILI